MGSAYGAHAHRYVDSMDGLRAVHGVPLHIGFGVGDSNSRTLPRSLDMGSAPLLQVRLPDGKPYEELGIRS